MTRIEAGRADLAEKGERIMQGLREKAAEAARDPLPAPGRDTLYYTRTTLVRPDGSYQWQAQVQRGMAPRVPPFEARSHTLEALERQIVRRYADRLEEHAYGNLEARLRASTCALELVSEEAISMLPTGRVTR